MSLRPKSACASPPAHLAILVVLLLPLSNAAIMSGSIGTDSPRLNRTNGLYEICISDWSPMVTCDGITSDQYSGYMVSLFQAVVERAGWTPDQWYYRCMDWTPMVDDLLAANGTCFMSAAGMDVTPAALATGVVFSWPTYKQGLQVLVANSGLGTSVWAVFHAFHWTVWLALGLTSVAVGWTLWITERYGARLPIFSSDAQVGVPGAVDLAGPLTSGPSLSGPSAFALMSSPSIAGNPAMPLRSPPLGGHATKMEVRNARRKRLHKLVKDAARQAHGKEHQTVGTMFYYSIAKLVDMGEPDPLTWGGRIIVFAYGLLVLIMVNLYTAQTASVITTADVRHTFQSVSELVGRRVGTWFPYLDELANKGIRAVGLPWENKADETSMLNLLLRNGVDALILDTSFVKYTASQNCSFTAVGRAFNTWSLAFAFPAETPPADVTAVSLNLVTLQQKSDVMDTLEDQFITLAACTTSGDVATVTFQQVKGLWIILGGAVGICFLLLATARLMAHFELRLGRGDSTTHCGGDGACGGGGGSSAGVPSNARTRQLGSALMEHPPPTGGRVGQGLPESPQLVARRRLELQNASAGGTPSPLGRYSSVEAGCDLSSYSAEACGRLPAPTSPPLVPPSTAGRPPRSRPGSGGSSMELLRGQGASLEVHQGIARSPASLELLRSSLNMGTGGTMVNNPFYQAQPTDRTTPSRLSQ